MKKNDEVFGEILYDGFYWAAKKDISFFTQKSDVDVLISVDDEEDEILEEQQQAYSKLWENWEDIQQEILEAVFEYYKEEQEVWDYSEEDGYPSGDSAEELIETLSMRIVHIYKPREDKRRVSIVFEADWDESSGVGVVLVDEEVVEAGPRDIAR